MSAARELVVTRMPAATRRLVVVALVLFLGSFLLFGTLVFGRANARIELVFSGAGAASVRTLIEPPAPTRVDAGGQTRWELPLGANATTPLAAGSTESVRAYLTRMLSARGVEGEILAHEDATSVLPPDQSWIARFDSVLLRAPGGRLDPLFLLVLRKRDAEVVHPFVVRVAVEGRSIVRGELDIRIPDESGARRGSLHGGLLDLTLVPQAESDSKALLSTHGAAGFRAF